MNVNNVVLNGTNKTKQVEQILKEQGAPYTPGEISQVEEKLNFITE